MQENEQDEVNQTVSKELDSKKYLRKNIIFYGVPGCGKSYTIDKLLHLKASDDGASKSLDKKYYRRILFHPEYTYSDFVGQIMPKKEGDSIDYVFQPGPFVEILKVAQKDPNNHYFLIIEEINRGNAPAIFGDLFQLLDRDDEGESEYGIYNAEILKELDRREGAPSLDESPEGEVRIPKNLTIFATMNTCDQNVFTLDTAFKRRWRTCRIKNSFQDKDGNPIVDWKIKFGEKEIPWKDFAVALNQDILERCHDGTAAEDKLLGTHFVKESDCEDAQVFAEKVLMYLWADVAKYDRLQLFSAIYQNKTLDDAIDDFVRGKNVFSEQCVHIARVYLTYLSGTPQTEGNMQGDGIQDDE